MEGPKDDLKWFGEGFDGFPKKPPEDCVEYTLYVVAPGLKDPEIRDRLRAIQVAANKLNKGLLTDFIWQREPFKLDLVREAGKVMSQYCHLIEPH